LNQSSLKNAQINVEACLPNSVQSQLANQGGIRIKQSLAVQDRCMLLIQDSGDIVCWGGNEKGQLGLGHYEDISQPQIMDSFSRAGMKIS
jgi:alpha-tubulin suppressor-like RCC1 family protein